MADAATAPRTEVTVRGVLLGIVITIVFTAAQGGKEGRPEAAHLGSPVKIANRVLQNTLKQGGQLFGGPVPIAFRQLHHGVLNDIQGIFFVMHGKPGRFIGPALDIGKKSIQFAWGGQAIRSGRKEKTKNGAILASLAQKRCTSYHWWFSP